MKTKQKERKLPLKKETWAKDILNIANVIIVAIDTNCRVILINEKGCKTLGYKRSEIIGKNWFSNFLPPRDRNQVKVVFNDIMLNKRKLTEYHENPILTKRGKERIIAWHNTALRDEKGHIIATLSSGEDITERKNSERLLKIQHDLAMTLSAISKLEDGLQTCLDAALTASGMDCGGIYLANEPSGTLELAYHKGLTPDFIENISHYEAGSSNMRLVMKGNSIYTQYNALGVSLNKVERGEGLRAIAVIPIHHKDKVIGCMNIASHSSDDIPLFARHALETIAAEIGNSIIRLRTEEKIKQLVVIDSHTGCYNHRYFEDIIESEFSRASRSRQPLSVIMLDVDYFKSINDVYGHQFGDMVLTQLVGQIKKIVRPYDIIIRYGGEEFIILSPGISKGKTLQLAQRVLDSVNLHNFGTKKQIVKLKLSMAAVSYPEDGIVKVDDFIDVADKVLNKVKEYGGNRVCDCSVVQKARPRPLGIKSEIESVKRLKTKIDRLTKRANESLTESIFAFAKTIELKDHYTGSHVERTVTYAVKIAEATGLSDDEVDCVRKAAILHDLGKIGISEKILNKTSKLTKKEFDIIKSHPQIGADIIRPIHSLHDVIPFMLYHHEWWNGKGYPRGLKGEEIPLGARIVSIADAYQALTSNRPYRKAFAKKKALEIIKKEAGIKFDPKVIDVFIKIVERKK